MLFSLIISIPLFVSLFWLIYLLVAFLHERLGKLSPSCKPYQVAICLFFLATTLLYGCHYLYFAGYGNKVLETLYATCNLIVYPLFYLYLVQLTSSGRDGMHTISTTHTASQN